MSDLLDRISELEQQIATLKAEVEKEEKEKDPSKRWRAEESNIYWFVLGCECRPDFRNEYNRNIDIFNYDTHNYFQTEDKAQKYASVLETERQLKKFADEHNDKIDWSDIDLGKYYLAYNYDMHSTSVYVCWLIREPRIIYFSSREIAKQAIDAIGKDKIREYLTYEW